MDPEVSVIIPSYNEAAFIGGCLDSLKAQTRKNFEIIVVDSSTDETPKIARKHGCRVFRQARCGPAEARNFGAAKAKGEILVFADADVRFRKDFMARIGEKFSSKALGGAICKLNAYDCDRRSDAMAYSLINLVAKAMIRSRFIVTSGSCFIYTRKAFSQAGGFNTALWTNEDHDLARRVGKIARFGVFSDIEVLTSARRVKRWGFWKTVRINVKSALLYFMAKKPLPEYWQS
jgi:glycosyltransferase involved in cell wall biosynthesis